MKTTLKRISLIPLTWFPHGSRKECTLKANELIFMGTNFLWGKNSLSVFVKTGFHSRAPRSLLFEKSFYAIGQKKNEAIPSVFPTVAVEKI